MYGICLDCGEIYDLKRLNQNENSNKFCPKSSCNGIIVHIDELMIPIIKKLWELGYDTNYCCSGHAVENIIGSYISFGEYTNDTIFDNLPKSWKVQKNGENFSIYAKKFDFNADNLIEKQKKIFKLITDLMNWVEKLPELNPF